MINAFLSHAYHQKFGSKTNGSWKKLIVHRMGTIFYNVSEKWLIPVCNIFEYKTTS